MTSLTPWLLLLATLLPLTTAQAASNPGGEGCSIGDSTRVGLGIALGVSLLLGGGLFLWQFRRANHLQAELNDLYQTHQIRPENEQGKITVINYHDPSSAEPSPHNNIAMEESSQPPPQTQQYHHQQQQQEISNSAEQSTRNTFDLPRDRSSRRATLDIHSPDVYAPSTIDAATISRPHTTSPPPPFLEMSGGDERRRQELDGSNPMRHPPVSSSSRAGSKVALGGGSNNGAGSRRGSLTAASRERGGVGSRGRAS